MLAYSALYEIMKESPTMTPAMEDKNTEYADKYDVNELLL